ncbi:hypothetical protein F2Q69_00012040 [Brassica cretica]|uniref:Uncharacterized protein n=1 Tax=Brassica cretica TaxID=69181 RepID=A0A8S9QNQ6_BRACR|nr:hypothetical protein F2Q69_00012040 [Brassica cretica]
MRSEIGDKTRPPPPLAVAYGEEKESRPGERERSREEREREKRRGKEREKREVQQGEREKGERRRRERESRWLGLPVSGSSLQSFASRLMMRD